MYRQQLEEIDSKQSSQILKFDQHDQLQLNSPKTIQKGLYWLYSSYSDEEFCQSERNPKKGSINFKEMVNMHIGLNHICQQEVQGFKLVYNGKAKCLRERIQSHVNGGEGTGSLAIKGSSLNCLSRWRYSYILWSDVRKIFPSIKYSECATDIELLWRLHFGWPILCQY